MRKWIFDSVGEEIEYWLDDIIDDFNYKYSNCGAELRGSDKNEKNNILYNNW